MHGGIVAQLETTGEEGLTVDDEPFLGLQSSGCQVVVAVEAEQRVDGRADDLGVVIPGGRSEAHEARRVSSVHRHSLLGRLLDRMEVPVNVGCRLRSGGSALELVRFAR